MESSERNHKHKKKKKKQLIEVSESGEDLGSESDTDAPYQLHRYPNGEVRICINSDGSHRPGIATLFGSARTTLADSGRLSLTGTVQKYVTQYGIYSVHIYLRLLKDLIYWKEKGIAHTIKSAIQLPLTLGVSVLGGLFPSMLGSSESSFETAASGLFWFLSDEASSALVVFLSVMIVTAYGSQLVDKILSGVFNRILNTPDTSVYFTEAEKEAILASPDIAPDQRAQLENAIDFLQGEYEKRANKYQDFKHRGDHHLIQRSAEKLRLGNPKQLLNFATYIRDKKGISMSLRDVEQGTQDSRELEMLFAQRVLQDFRPKFRD